MLPDRVRRWAEDRLPDGVVAWDRVPGGITDTIWRGTDAGGGRVILRWVEPARLGLAGRQHVVREALGCRLTAGSDLPAPRLLATDPDSTGTGGWANLTTFLPGRVRLEALGWEAIDALARLAVQVHAVEVPAGSRPPGFVFWGESEPTVPAWAGRPAVWEAAIALAGQRPPDTVRGFLHRDFHPGNTLWVGDGVTGLVDWAETSWGPADLDVAHACSNFAMLTSLEAAEGFRRAYVAQGGRLDPDPGNRRYWAVRDVLGFLPDPAPIVAALTQQRPDLRVTDVHHRLEELLVSVLGGAV